MGSSNDLMDKSTGGSKKNLSPAQLLWPPNWNKIPKHFKGGNDEQREKYVNFKRTLMSRTLKPRFDILEACKRDATWEIPWDQGFKVVPPGTFPQTDYLAEAARQCVAQGNPDQAKTQKSQLILGLINQKELTLDSQHIQFGLREDILRAVTVYLGVAPIIEDIDVWSSISLQSDTWSNSQLWHCDSIDTAQIKIFLYSNDVGPDSGPLTVLSAAASKRVRDAINYEYIGEARVADEKINELVKPEEIHPITGPAGTCVFVDTSRCFHYGSRVKSGAAERIITLYQYLSPTAFVLPMDFKSKAPFRHLANSQLSQLQRFALGAD